MPSKARRPLFRPAPASTVMLALVAAGAFLLGEWQRERWNEKKALEAAYANPPVVEAGGTVGDLPLWATVALDGRYDTERHFLLDQQFENGRVGLHVLTPFRTEAGEWVLVNRGWLPMSPRREWPEFDTPPGPRRITGQLARDPEAGIALGEPEPAVEWPRLVVRYDAESVAAALDLAAPPPVVWLDADDPTGFGERRFSPVSMPSERHLGYAVQWYALTATALVIWFILGWRRARTVPAKEPLS